MKALAKVRDVLLAIHQKAKKSGQGERILWRGTVAMPATMDMAPLRQALRGHRFDRRILRKNDQQENARLITHMDRVLKDTQAVMEKWNYYAMKLGCHTMNSARLIVPDDITGAVILDATASSNVVYEIFDRAEIVSTPSCRDYANVMLHVSRGHAVGKAKMVKHAKAEAAKLFQNLQDSLPAVRCCALGRPRRPQRLVRPRHGSDLRLAVPGHDVERQYVHGASWLTDHRVAES